MNLNLRIVIPAAIALVLAMGIGGYFYYQSTRGGVQGAQNAQQTQEETKKIVSEVGKLIELPTGEDPTVATVTDITKLVDQPFFANAKNGDKVLIYTNARKAILYNPSLKKVIEVAPINIGSPSAQESAKVVLRNGTTTVGLTARIEAELKKTNPNISVVTKENASKNDFEKSVVVVLNESFKATAEELAKALETTVGTLPEGENKPTDVDILIILGKDNS